MYHCVNSMIVIMLLLVRNVITVPNSVQPIHYIAVCVQVLRWRRNEIMTARGKQRLKAKK